MQQRFLCRSYCLLNMFRAPLCPSSGAQEYFTVVAACGISCCGFSSCWSGVELRVMCPVCRMLQTTKSERTCGGIGKKKPFSKYWVPKRKIILIYKHLLTQPVYVFVLFRSYGFISLFLYIYIYVYRSANLQTLHFKYLFNKYTY